MGTKKTKTQLIKEAKDLGVDLPLDVQEIVHKIRWHNEYHYDQDIIRIILKCLDYTIGLETDYWYVILEDNGFAEEVPLELEGYMLHNLLKAIRKLPDYLIDEVTMATDGQLFITSEGNVGALSRVTNSDLSKAIVVEKERIKKFQPNTKRDLMCEVERVGGIDKAIKILKQKKVRKS